MGAGRSWRPGAWCPGSPIAFGSGILVYFTADREPALWAASHSSLRRSLFAVLARHRPVAFPVMLGIAAAACGFATATAKRTMISHPVLSAPVWNADVAGFVEVREERERTDRIVVRVERIAAPRLKEAVERVRVSVRKGTAPAVGSFVEFKARLSPPLAPLRPGGYDFARDMYFQGIGASGFVLGSIRTTPPEKAPSLWLRYAAVIAGLREAIDQRIRAVVPGDQGAIASALITGKRDALTAPVFDAMYVSGIGHVLSISGYHMAVVAGIIFFVLRASFALMPAFTGRHSIKKWAAFAALCVAAFYLLLSGAEVATQRSFIMIAIVLVGVMVDRQTLTLRTITVAALGVLLLAPEAVVHPSFQMSFAATLALVAGYQQGLPWMNGGAETPLGARIALWGGREIAGLLIVSLLAGTATIPYAAYHFHRIAPYGVLANLLAMPVVSAWVMPSGILGVLALPFGLDGYCWRLMGAGIDWMIFVAVWVTGLPGAVGRMAAFGTGPLLLCSAGLVLLCLFRTPLRLDRRGSDRLRHRARGPDAAARRAGRRGRQCVCGPRRRRAAGDDQIRQRRLCVPRMARWPTAIRAHPRTRRWARASAAMRPAASAGLPTVTRRHRAYGRGVRGGLPPRGCRAEPARRAARRVPRSSSTPDLRQSGAMALRRAGQGFEVMAARPAGYDRPWARAAVTPADAPGRSPSARPQPRDATPNVEDLEAGD